MTSYDIESTDFALSSDGVHLLRNKFNYKTINFDDIDKATFTKSAETRNVMLALTVGVLLVAFAIYNGIGVYENFHDPLVRHIYIESIVLPILPLLAGSYCIYMAIRKVPLLMIYTKSEKYKLSLKGIIKSGRMDMLKVYLNQKLGTRFYDSVAIL
jgi:hypothetical protein